ncbi:MAG TPA: F0F1 ATP synthase subunit alpha [Candidatus Portnoybacteria bacterium]|nr:F0F1 ATP synthase subunit alpha [Candidatus Portnoybacteria bacterium]
MPKEIGYIDKFYQGVGKITGLPSVFLHEILVWENKEPAALVIGYSIDFVEAIFFHPEKVDLGQPVFRSKKPIQILAGPKYLGRIVNGVGKPIDDLGVINEKKYSPIFKESPGIIDREPVTLPLFTGTKVIDSTLPIGRGQRELIIGDKKIGKTTLATRTLINQDRNKENGLPPVYGVYVLIGQKKDKIKETIKILKNYQVLDSSVVVATVADDPLVAQYLAPYVGCTIAEYFRDHGQDALIIYDDLTKHAKVYREISLLLERPPGREAYPGDIFYLHSTLLERAAKLSSKKYGGSLTALPIIETLENDITSFIPTNLISITDGQIYLDPNLFAQGILPAVNIGLSVSRVGSQAQHPLLKEVTKSLKLTISQYHSLKKLVQLESDLSKEAKEKFTIGELTLEALKQNKFMPISLIEEIIIFYGLSHKLFLSINKENWANFEEKLINYLQNEKEKEAKEILNQPINQAKKNIEKIIKEFLKKYENI